MIWQNYNDNMIVIICSAPHVSKAGLAGQIHSLEGPFGAIPSHVVHRPRISLSRKVFFKHVYVESCFPWLAKIATSNRYSTVLLCTWSGVFMCIADTAASLAESRTNRHHFPAALNGVCLVFNAFLFGILRFLRIPSRRHRFLLKVIDFLQAFMCFLHRVMRILAIPQGIHRVQSKTIDFLKDFVHSLPRVLRFLKKCISCCQ